MYIHMRAAGRLASWPRPAGDLVSGYAFGDMAPFFHCSLFIAFGETLLSKMRIDAGTWDPLRFLVNQ